VIDVRKRSRVGKSSFVLLSEERRAEARRRATTTMTIKIDEHETKKGEKAKTKLCKY